MAASILASNKMHLHPYTTFALSWASSTYSSSGISGMIHLREIGCNHHVPIRGNYDIVRLTSRAYKLKRMRGTKHTVHAIFNIQLFGRNVYYGWHYHRRCKPYGKSNWTQSSHGRANRTRKEIISEGEQFPRSNKTLWYLSKAQHYLLTRSTTALALPYESLACETSIKT